MHSLQLSTKFLPPRKGRGILPRPRLEHLIERIAEVTVVALSAPPGFGKSTLACAWAEAALARGGRVAWLNLDETDDSAERLLLYVTTALQQSVSPHEGTKQLGELALLPVEHLSSLLINDLEGQTEHFFLFIDDYHCVPPEVLTHAFEHLVRFAPDNLHLIFSGRISLPSALLSHLYPDIYLEVDATQLRFDLDETHSLILRSNNTGIDSAELIELHAATEGWAAALRASLLTQRHRLPRTPRLTSNINSLMDAVLDRLPATLANCLPYLAAIDKFDITLAEQLTELDNGAALIDELEHQQLFVTTLDEQSQWFSFHPLFREHLRRRLSTAALNSTLNKASHWYASQHSWMDAVRTALACGNIENARHWIAHCAMEMVEQGDFVILLDWQRQLHKHLLESPVQLKLALGWASGLAMDFDKSRQLLQTARTSLEDIQASDQRAQLAWECQALEAMLLALEDQSETAGILAKACLPHLGERPWISNTMLNVLYFSYLSSCRWQEFYTMPAMSLTPLEPSRHRFNQIYRLCLTGYSEALQGRFTQGIAILEEALHLNVTSPLGRHSRIQNVLRALPSGILAGLHYLQGNLCEAERLAIESIETVKIIGFLDCAGIVFITNSRLSSNKAYAQGARHFLEEGSRLAHTRKWPRLEAQLLLERTRVSLFEQKNHEARACERQLGTMAQTHTDDGSEYACLATLAALWCNACGLSHGIELENAENLRTHAQQAGMKLMQLRLTASLAIVYWHQRMPERAINAIREVAELLEYCDTPQLIQDLPAQETLNQLISHFLRLPGETTERKTCLQRFLLKDTGTPTEKSATRLIITLTTKERNVLALVAQGKSNKEMAKLLGVTPETIKSHMKHIFSKLQVDSRAQAAVTAKACGLI